MPFICPGSTCSEYSLNVCVSSATARLDRCTSRRHLVLNELSISPGSLLVNVVVHYLSGRKVDLRAAAMGASRSSVFSFSLSMGLLIIPGTSVRRELSGQW